MPMEESWKSVRLGGERMVDVSRELGYRDGGSVLQVVKRMEQAAESDTGLRRRMEELRQTLGLSRVEGLLPKWLKAGSFFVYRAGFSSGRVRVLL